ncbi:MAG: class B sortase [Oscillospiraceae bacterium]
MSFKYKRKKKKSSMWLLLLLLPCVCGVVFFGIKILKLNELDSQSKQIYESVEQKVFAAPQEDNSTQQNDAYCSPVSFKALEDINSDSIAWLKCEGTLINYPIVQGSDNEYYLKHTIMDEWSDAGCVFLDFRNSDEFSDMQSIVFGHNFYRKDLMFTSLMNYKEQEYYEKFPTMSLYTPNEEYEIEIFSGYEIEAVQYDLKLNYDSEDEYADFLRQVQDKSDFRSNAVPTSADRIFTMCTCAPQGDNQRYILHGILEMTDKGE